MRVFRWKLYNGRRSVFVRAHSHVDLLRPQGTILFLPSILCFFFFYFYPNFFVVLFSILFSVQLSRLTLITWISCTCFTSEREKSAHLTKTWESVVTLCSPISSITWIVTLFSVDWSNHRRPFRINRFSSCFFGSVLFRCIPFNNYIQNVWLFDLTIRHKITNFWCIDLFPTQLIIIFKLFHFSRSLGIKFLSVFVCSKWIITDCIIENKQVFCDMFEIKTCIKLQAYFSLNDADYWWFHPLYDHKKKITLTWSWFFKYFFQIDKNKKLFGTWCAIKLDEGIVKK